MYRMPVKFTLGHLSLFKCRMIHCWGRGREESEGEGSAERRGGAKSLWNWLQKSSGWECWGHMFLLLVFQLQLLNQRWGRGWKASPCNLIGFQRRCSRWYLAHWLELQWRINFSFYLTKKKSSPMTVRLAAWESGCSGMSEQFVFSYLIYSHPSWQGLPFCAFILYLKRDCL